MSSRGGLWARSMVISTMLCSAALAQAEPEPAATAGTDPGKVKAEQQDLLSTGWSVEIEQAFGQVSKTWIDGGRREVTVPGARFGARWLTSSEYVGYGYSSDVSVSDVLTATPRITSDGPFEPSRNVTVTDNVLSVTLAAEARVYSPPAFAFIGGDLSVGLHTIRGVDDGRYETTSLPGSVRVAAGVGVGRIVTVDPVVRLKRFEDVLSARGALTGPIPVDVGTRVIRDWRASRRELGTARGLARTFDRLQEAGVLAGELDNTTLDKALQVLSDPYIVNRRSGFDLRFGFGLVTSFIGFDEEERFAEDTEDAPVLAIVASGRREQPLSTTGQLSMRFDAMYEMGDPHGSGFGGASDREWRVRGFLRYSRILYAADNRPRGLLGLSVEAGVSDVRPRPYIDPRPPAQADVSAIGSFSIPVGRGLLLGASIGTHRVRDGDDGYTVGFGLAWQVASSYFAPYVVPAGV